jgi:putative effector of murein hydrolase
MDLKQGEIFGVVIRFFLSWSLIYQSNFKESLMKASVTTLLAEKAHNIYSINASASVLDAVNEMNHRGVG